MFLHFLDFFWAIFFWRGVQFDPYAKRATVTRQLKLYSWSFLVNFFGVFGLLVFGDRWVTQSVNPTGRPPALPVYPFPAVPVQARGVSALFTFLMARCSLKQACAVPKSSGRAGPLGWALQGLTLIMCFDLKSQMAK